MDGESPPRILEGLRNLWRRLQAEDLPRVVLYFAALLILADNLRRVKTMAPNRPVLNPEDD